MPVVSIPPAFRCSITLELFDDPVVTADGHTYDRKAIERHFANNKDKSPLTNEPLPNLTLVPNRHLKSQVSSFRETVMSSGRMKTLIETGDLKTLETADFLPLLEYDDIKPLFLAVRSNQLSVLRYLIKQSGDDPAAVKDNAGNTLLHAVKSSPDIVRYLIGDCKLPVEQKNDAGYTPLLHVLADDPDLSVVRALLTAGADTKASTDTTNVLDAGPINQKLAALLVEFGAGVPSVVEQVFPNGSSILHRKCWSASHIATDLFNYFLSLIPTEARRVAIVRREIRLGLTMLHLVVRNPDILRLVLAPPYSLLPTSTNVQGETALHYWSAPGWSSDASAETLSILLAAGTPIDAKMKDGRTAMHCAAQDAVRFDQLATAGADAGILDADGQTALECVSMANLRILYTKSIDAVNRAAGRTDESKSYVGKKVEVLDGKSWRPAMIVQLDDAEKKIKIHFYRLDSKYDSWFDVEAQKSRIRMPAVPKAVQIPEIWPDWKLRPRPPPKSYFRPVPPNVRPASTSSAAAAAVVSNESNKRGADADIDSGRPSKRIASTVSSAAAASSSADD